MKKVLLVIFMNFFSLSLLAQTQITLHPNNGFLLLNDVESSEVKVYASEVGRRFNHCGIQLKSNKATNLTPEKLKSALTIRRGWSSSLEDISNLSGWLIEGSIRNPNHSHFGAYFLLSTRSGRTFKDELFELNEENEAQALVILESMKCH